MDWKPKRWIALVLGILIPPAALLYAGSWRWALSYTLAILGLMMLAMFTITADDQGQLLLNLLQVTLIIAVIWHAFEIIRNYEPRPRRRWYSRWYGIATIYLAFALPILLIRIFVFEPFRLPSGSMEPEFPRNSQIVIEKFGYGNYELFGVSLIKTRLTKELYRGDAVVFHLPQDTRIEYLKRIIGLPGDHIEYRNKALWINERPITQSFLYSKVVAINGLLPMNYDIAEESFDGRTWKIQNAQNAPARDFTVNVPPGMYFVMGDNRDNSNDSRFWGYVPESEIKGKVLYRF